MKELLQALSAQGSGDKWRETRYGSSPHRFTGSHVVVQTQLTTWVPARLEALPATLDPPGEKVTIFIRSIDELRYLKQGLVGGHQDGAEEYVLDQEGVRIVDSRLVASGSFDELN